MNKPVVSDLKQNLVDALKEKEQEGFVLLGVKNTDSPQEIVRTIRELVDRLLSENHSEEDLRESALQLGAVWGSMVVKKYKWSWKYLDFGDGIKGIYLVSPSSFYCCPPLYFLTNILLGGNTGLDGENDNTILLSFNMMDGIENQKPKQNFQIIT